jgi:HTH-type transcriptional regulator / antitoxin HigA
MAHLLDPAALQSEADYRAALAELDDLVAADPGAPAGHRFEELVNLIEAWEARDHPPPLRWPLR